MGTAAEIAVDDEEKERKKAEKEQRRIECEDRYFESHRKFLLGDGDWDDVIEDWNKIAENEGEYGGAPFPTDEPLILEPQFPFDQLRGAHAGKFRDEVEHERQQLAAYYLWEQDGRPEGDGRDYWLEAGEYIKNPKKRNPKDRYQLVNRWYSPRLNADIFIWYDQQEKKYIHRVDHDRWIDRLNFLIKTNFVGKVWSLRAEYKAQEKLKKHLKHDQFRHYMLTGCFLEDSKKSGLRYMFRKSRPTIVFSPRQDFRVVCCLCLHGTGYYANTWAGVLTPTDDVIIHLMNMRTDEYNYWKRSNHHSPRSALSGV